MTKGLSLERIRLFWGASCKYTNVTPHFFLIFEIMEAANALARLTDPAAPGDRPAAANAAAPGRAT